MNVFTIGYEGLDIDRFLSLLKENDIETIVDIRELPISRKPGFSKSALANALNLSGYEYIHMSSLGCPKSVRNRYREDGNWESYSKGFLNYLSTQESSIHELSHLVMTSNCALLCYESDYNFCHRSMVANAVRDNCNVTIKHILSSSTKIEKDDAGRFVYA